jgi:hypothetical protein
MENVVPSHTLNPATMRLIRVLTLSLLALSLSCDDPIDEGITQMLSFEGVFKASDGTEVQLTTGGRAYYNKVGTFKYSDGTTKSVGDMYMLGMIYNSPKTYTGSVMSRTGLFDQGTVHISDAGLTIDGGITTHASMTRLSSLTSGSFAGSWNRVIGSTGSDTDVQIGGMEREPPSRVYLCALSSTSSTGLYKGILLADGVTIRWDPEYRIPDYTMKSSSEGMQFYVGTALGGTYKKGSWRKGSCGLSF